MFVKKGLIVIVFGVLALFLGGCSVGTGGLFVHPAEQGFQFEVTYDTMGGHINQLKTRTVYYADNSLLYQPNGTSGMLVEAKNGEKTLAGWYTNYTELETANGVVYKFEEEDLWDFENHRVSEESIPELSLTLYARWVDNPVIRFLDSEDLENTELLKWTIGMGNVLSKPTSTEPRKSGFTLMDYYVDAACTTKYVFGEVVTEETASYDEQGNAYINIYCKFLEGTFTRIKTISQLKSIEETPDAYYLLANDLDLSKETLKPMEGFSGVFFGNGYTISNLTVNAKSRVAGIAAKNAKEMSFGLFATLDGATISDLTMKDTSILIDSSSNVSLAVGTLAGRTKRATITNCIFDGVTIEADGNCTIDIYASPTVVGDRATKLTDVSLLNVNEAKITTKGTLQVLDGN